MNCSGVQRTTMLIYDWLWRAPAVSCRMLALYKQLRQKHGQDCLVPRVIKKLKSESLHKRQACRFWHGLMKASFRRANRSWHHEAVVACARELCAAGPSIDASSFMKALQNTAARRRLTFLNHCGRYSLLRTLSLALGVRLTHDEKYAANMSPVNRRLSGILSVAAFCNRARGCGMAFLKSCRARDVSYFYCTFGQALRELGLLSTSWAKTATVAAYRKLILGERCRSLLECLRRATPVNLNRIVRETGSAADEQHEVDKVLRGLPQKPFHTVHSCLEVCDTLPHLRPELLRLGFSCP